MTEIATRDIPLNWEVFVTPGIPTITSDLPPGTKQQMWSPISSTLIYGRRDAVLVDTFITVEQENALVDWVGARGKNLTGSTLRMTTVIISSVPVRSCNDFRAPALLRRRT
jgi:hypothetical protein